LLPSPFPLSVCSTRQFPEGLFLWPQLSVHCLGQTKVRLKPPVPGGWNHFPSRGYAFASQNIVSAVFFPHCCFQSSPVTWEGVSQVPSRGYAFASQNIVSAVFFPQLIASGPRGYHLYDFASEGREVAPLVLASPPIGLCIIVLSKGLSQGPRICKRKPKHRFGGLLSPLLLPVQSSNVGGGESSPLPRICIRKPGCR
jgi:hypothetical protein